MCTTVYKLMSNLFNSENINTRSHTGWYTGLPIGTSVYSSKNPIHIKIIWHESKVVFCVFLCSPFVISVIYKIIISIGLKYLVSCVSLKVCKDDYSVTETHN